MPFTKVTTLFHAATTDFDGNGKRLAGFSESWYSTLPPDSTQLNANWSQLCTLRAALMAKNVTIVGQRIQTVRPTGASRSFDTVYPGPSTAANDLPSMALQWTVRSTTPNQRSVILRGIPDARVINGEYNNVSTYDAAIVAYFTHLKANWGYLGLDRTILPVKLVSVDNAGLVTTMEPHGLAVGDDAEVMSAVNVRGVKHSAVVRVLTVPSDTTFTVFVPRLGRDEPPTAPFVFNTVRGRVRKLVYAFKDVQITSSEMTNPTAITRKAGRPFRVFRGRRTARR